MLCVGFVGALQPHGYRWGAVEESPCKTKAFSLSFFRRKESWNLEPAGHFLVTVRFVQRIPSSRIPLFPDFLLKHGHFSSAFSFLCFLIVGATKDRVEEMRK